MLPSASMVIQYRGASLLTMRPKRTASSANSSDSRIANIFSARSRRSCIAASSVNRTCLTDPLGTSVTRWEDDGDPMLVGGASLVTLSKGEDPPSSEFKWAVGEGLLQFDVDVEVLAKAGELLNVWFSAEHPPPLIIYIFSSNMSALWTITNPRSKSHQAATIRFHKAPDSLYSVP